MSSENGSKDMNKERKFLEGLLRDRFNFFIVMAPAYLFGVFKLDLTTGQRALALAVGFIVFGLFSGAIWRTNYLINTALDILCEDKTQSRQPYAILCDRAWKHPRANTLLVAVSVVVVLFTLVLTLITLCALCPSS